VRVTRSGMREISLGMAKAIRPQQSGGARQLNDELRPGQPFESIRNGRRLPTTSVRLNSAIGYITPRDMLAGHQQEIQAERDRKLEAAREQRKNRRQRAA
jgi:hypothetical protein